MPDILCLQLAAFTSTPFTGNPAAVCILPEDRSTEWMQAVAREFKLSETAFVRLKEEEIELRWFTPAYEVDLCGHATLATAQVLWQEALVPEGRPIAFQTRSGTLTATREGSLVQLDFPATPVDTCNPPAGLEGALGVPMQFVGRSRFDVLVETDSEETVQQMQPDFRLLEQIETRGVIVTAVGEKTNADFVSRFFAPKAGVDEDPVTGSAHCALTPFWASRLDKTSLTARQLSPRGGLLKVSLQGDRVTLSGETVTTWRGRLQV